MDFSGISVGDYCRIDDENIDTECFRVLTDIEIIDEDHKFIAFLNGFTHFLIEGKIIHGWYHIPTKTAKFLVNTNPSKFGNLIHWAWKRYWKDESYDCIKVHIYYNHCGLYDSNEYNIDKNQCYKDLITHLLTEMD